MNSRPKMKLAEFWSFWQNFSSISLSITYLSKKKTTGKIRFSTLYMLMLFSRRFILIESVYVYDVYKWLNIYCIPYQNARSYTFYCKNTLVQSWALWVRGMERSDFHKFYFDIINRKHAHLPYSICTLISLINEALQLFFLGKNSKPYTVINDPMFIFLKKGLKNWVKIETNGYIYKLLYMEFQKFQPLASSRPFVYPSWA